MTYQSNFRKWTNRLIEEFAGGETHKEMRSTGDSFNRTASQAWRSDSQTSYKEMPSNYKRYADSLEAKRKNIPSPDGSFENLARMAFVQYRHFPHQDLCAQECKLKKKAKQCRCFGHKQRECCHKGQNKVQEQKPPTIIKEIHTVVVQSPPTIIRQYKQPATVVRPAPIIRQVRTVQTANRPVTSNSYVRREVVQSPSPSASKITINYVSPPKPLMAQSILLAPPNQPQHQQPCGSPYKMLQSSRHQDEVPQIVISQPLEYQAQQLSESQFTFEEQRSRRGQRQRRRIFPEREAETAKFIGIEQMQSNQTNRTNMSESFKIFNAQKQMRESSMMYHKLRSDRIRE